MWVLLKIYFLFNIHFNIIKCDPSQNTDELSVRIVDKKLIERKRQDTRDMCRRFNSEAIAANLQAEAAPFNKYDKRKKELKLKEKNEKLFHKAKTHRFKRALNDVNPALNVEDEERIETIVDKIYDDFLEKGQKIAYRRKEMNKAEVNSNIWPANKTGRRFPFAPIRIDGPIYHQTTPIPDGNKSVRFPQAIVPYFIDSRSYDTHLSEIIMNAFDYFEKVTCIRLQRLRERPSDQKSLQNVVWLYITNPSSLQQCVHSNERAEIKGVQMIVFGYNCMTLGDIVHEIMHVLGFSHEHLRPDRDQYITILWDNIKPGYRKYFEIHNKHIVENLPYDYASVMHYPPRAFSKNGQFTILTAPGIKIGQREGLSAMDIEKIELLYANECIKRNREYLLKTCPSVVKSDTKPKEIPQRAIDDYFQDRLWPYGVVNYKLRDMLEFSSEEIENINAVISHLQNETCIEFRDLTSSNEGTDVAAKENEDDEPSNDETEEYNSIRNNLIIDPVKAIRKSMGGKNINGVKRKSANTDGKDKDTNIHIHIKGKDANIDAKGRTANISASAKDANIGAKGKTVNIAAMAKDANIGAKGKTANIAAKAKDANIGAKGKTANVTRKQSVLRKRRAVPSLPTRRHASSILVLARSPQPGCQCPPPGKPDGSYLLYINTDCFNSVNDLLHLFVHVLGLDHQHNMHDRDSYLHIVWDKLTPDIKEEMQRKLPPAASVGFPYDYQSVMHYPWLQIKNGATNIMYPIWNDGWTMGHWQGLSATDVQKINLLYFKQCLEKRQQIKHEESQPKNSEEDETETEDEEEQNEEEERTRGLE